METSGEYVEEEDLTTSKSGLHDLVRRLSSGVGAGRRTISTYGRSEGSGTSNWSSNGCCNEIKAGPSNSSSNIVVGQQPVVGVGSTTVSASGAPSGPRGTLSRRSSRDLSPSKSSSSGSQDAASYGGGGGAGTASSGISTASSGQDWRRLVGSIRRKVRRKTTQSSSCISEGALQETSRNQDDFLKATMRIFLVVSPPMGRVQVNLYRREIQDRITLSLYYTRI